MSLFYCDLCDTLSDSDEGCEEAPTNRYGLVCIACVDELRDDGEADEETQ